MILPGLTRDLQAGLFSAIVTAFLIKALDDLRPDYQQQAALLLHQLLNGRDPNLENISDPTVPQKPASSAIAVNCFWFASLSASLGASFGAIICKGWLTEYDSGANPVVGLLRACQRHMRFMALKRLNIHVLVAFLPALLHSSVLLFIMGAIIYLFRMNGTVAIVFVVIGGVFSIAYLLLTILPFVTNPPFRHYSTFLPYQLSVAIGEVVISIVDVFAHICYLTLRRITSMILFPFVRTIFSAGTRHDWYMRVRAIFPRELKPMRVWWAKVLHDPPDDIDTSQKVQEEAILWLSQVPLDPFESKALVSSLAMISSSRPYNSFRKPVIVLANLVLEALSREVDQEQTDTAIDCVLVLGNIKFQSAVDRGLDHDHNVGGVPIPPSVAWAAQKLATSVLNNSRFDGIREQLLTAVAWLSPVDEAEDVSWDGRELRIQDRWKFIREIGMKLERHVRSDKPLNTKVLVNLIHGMHACIPRGSYDSTSSIVPFLTSFCEDYDSPWSKDETVLRALITYALDLLLPPERRTPLVERRIKFDDLASELIDALTMGETPYSDVVAFAFWLAYRVPYAFRSRKTILRDIAYIWHRTNEAIPEDHRERLNYYATDAFIAIAQHHVVANGGLPRLTYYTALRLLSSALESGYSRPVTIYTMAMILNIGTWTQVATVTSGIEVESIIHALFSSRDDPEGGTIDEEVVEVQIYSTLILLKLLAPTFELDVEKVKGLIVLTEEAIGNPGVTKSPRADVDVDLDRIRWKAIYLSALLFKFLPGDERENHIEGLWTRVQALLESGRLCFMGDCERCLEPLGTDVLELGTLAVDQQRQADTVFEVWIGGFPLFQLMGAVSEPPSGRKLSRLSFLNPVRFFSR